MSKVQAINRREFIRGLAAIPAVLAVSGGGQPAALHCSGCDLFMADGQFWWQTWQQRDDIAPGFRIGVVRRLG